MISEDIRKKIMFYRNYKTGGTNIKIKPVI